MADEKLTAATRIEKLLDNIAGGDNEVTPATRLEKFLSYIADAMEGGGGSGGGENYVKLLTGEYVVTTENPDAHFYAYKDQGWEDVSIGESFMVFNTTEDISKAFVLPNQIGGTEFPSSVQEVNIFATGETHADPESGEEGYYIEYADAYSMYTAVTGTLILVIKNGVVTYYHGLA